MGNRGEGSEKGSPGDAIPLERMVPDRDRFSLIYNEHVVRYMYASQFCQGKEVLDVACGSGYGSNLLARAGAASVAGVDISREAVEFGKAHYGSERCIFVRADARELPFSDSQFDVIVSLETIEHLSEQNSFLLELNRVIKRDGVLVISSPNKALYPAGNPFHIRELDLAEFSLLMREAFRFVEIAGQDNWVSTVILAKEIGSMEEGPVDSIKVAKSSGRSLERSLYFVATASQSPLPTADYHMLMARVSEPEFWLDEMARRDANSRRMQAALELEVAKSNVRLEELKEKEFTIRALHDSLEAAERNTVAVERLRQRISEKHLEFQIALNEATSLLNQKETLLREKEAELSTILDSAAWRTITLYRTLVAQLDHAPGLPARGLNTVLHSLISRAARSKSSANALSPAHKEPVRHQSRTSYLIFPEAQDPEVSIIIPVYNELDMTLNCLVSLIRNTTGANYEVIVVNDASTDETAMALNEVRNLRFISNAANVGFVSSANRGAQQARGRFLVFLNNDTEVRAGWLEALLAPALRDQTVGIVGAKLLYPDGRLQEAGCIVWRDGSGWNFGRGDDPGKAEYNYLREVDYCSAACLLVRRDSFELAGGFDARYCPAYYEDTDLAFSVRQSGYKVIYQPQAEVIHHEGRSHGLDVSHGIKSFQVANKIKFLEKWSKALQTQSPQSGAPSIKARDRNGRPRILVIDACVPTHDLDAGSLRMDWIIRLLLELGFAVDLLPDNGDPRQPYSRRFQQMGVEVLYGQQSLPSRLDELGSRLRFCIASRPNVAWKYVQSFREYAPSCKFIYDTVDLHFLREERRARWDRKESVLRAAKVYRELELSLTRVSDITLTVSNEEKALLQQEVPDSRIHVIPMIHEIHPDPAPFEKRSGLLFVGGFAHPPNAVAVFHFIAEIFPIVREQLPEADLRIVGSNIPSEIEALASPHVIVEGRVDDLEPVFQRSKMSIAPLTFGAGLKGKITQSISFGLPVVTTTIGLEGTGLTPDRDILVADGPQEFAEKILYLYTNKSAWVKMSEAGLKHADQRYSPAVVKDKLRQTFGHIDEKDV